MAKLGYWKIRGLAEPIRCLLVYVGEDFEDKQYEQEDAPGYSREAWMGVKPEFAKILDFPNLPYYIDGDIKITQSNAILKHIARKYKLDGADAKEKAIVDMLLDCAMDLRNGIVRLCYNKDYETLKEDYFKNLQNSLALYEKKLKDSEWFAGKNVTVADFPFYELFFQLLKMKPDCLDGYPAIKAFQQKFESQPQIKDYVSKDAVKNMPCNNKTAQFK